MAAGSASTGSAAGQQCEPVQSLSQHRCRPDAADEAANEYSGHLVAKVASRLCVTAIADSSHDRLPSQRIHTVLRDGCVPSAPAAEAAAPAEAADAAPPPAAAAAPPPAAAAACASFRPMPSPPAAPSSCKLHPAASAVQAEAKCSECAFCARLHLQTSVLLAAARGDHRDAEPNYAVQNLRCLIPGKCRGKRSRSRLQTSQNGPGRSGLGTRTHGAQSEAGSRELSPADQGNPTAPTGAIHDRPRQEDT
jgi:hypothetical protein